jgi:hypothetical protein
MASSWGRALSGVLFLAAVALPQSFEGGGEARAAASSPPVPMAPPDPLAMSAMLEQGWMVRVFDTTSIGATLGEPSLPTTYVNDHTFVQGRDGRWHLFGIWHREPFTPDGEVDFIHAVAMEPDPARWDEGAFAVAARPYTVALHADASIGETHIWAPHVVSAEGRYWMTYQGGGADRDRSSIRLAESADLYQWTRVGEIPLFEDICEARDPMVVRKDDLWAMYYTRCDSAASRTSGVAYRLSRNLSQWSEPHMVLTLESAPHIPNSGYTESPFVFERDHYHYLSVTSYPVEWDATMLYRSPAPYAFPSVPFTRLRGHAGEWLTSASGRRVFFSHAGPGQRGVLLSEIRGL